MSIQVRRVTMLLAAVALVAGCAPRAADETQAPWPPETSRPKVVYVVSHGWHTGIVVRYADIPGAMWPEKADLSDKTYLEVGWGDETFYRAREITLGMALKAAFTPTRSVLHVVGFNSPVEQFFSSSGVVELRVSEQGFRNLVRYIHDAVERQIDRPAAAIGPGLYGSSRFYLANGTYSLLFNSNHWVAHALYRSGAPVATNNAATANEVFRQASQFGRVIRRPP